MTLSRIDLQYKPFKYYINDLPKPIKSTKEINVSMFADDIIWGKATNNNYK